MNTLLCAAVFGCARPAASIGGVFLLRRIIARKAYDVLEFGERHLAVLADLAGGAVRRFGPSRRNICRLAGGPGPTSDREYEAHAKEHV